MANKRGLFLEKISDNILKQRIKFGWLNLCISLPVLLAMSYFGWVNTKFFFGFGSPPELVRYSPLFMCLTILVVAFAPVYITNLWYVVMRKPMPLLLRNFFSKMLTVLCILWVLQAVPFHFLATNYLEDNGYVFCSERPAVRGIQVYALDENLCLK